MLYEVITDPLFFFHAVFQPPKAFATDNGRRITDAYLKEFFDASERPAMNRTISKLADGRFMGAGRVSFVLRKTELWIVFIVSFHQSITGNLGHDRCGCDGDA